MGEFWGEGQGEDVEVDGVDRGTEIDGFGKRRVYVDGFMRHVAYHITRTRVS